MYRLFTRPLTNRGKIESPGMERIRNLIYTYDTYWSTRYKEYGFFINSTHVLNKLAYVLDDYLSEGSDTYRMIDDTIDDICSGLGITTDNRHGRLFNDAFYTSHCAIIATSYRDIMDSTFPPWQEIRAVRTLTHPFTSLDIIKPCTNKDDMGSGFAAVGIDIALFGYQLKQWTIFNKSLDPLEQESITMFLSKYVVPNMMPEHIDIALRNRITYIYSEMVPIDTPVKARSFAVSYEAAIVHPIVRVLEVINASRMPYVTGLQELPFIYSDTYFEAVPMEIASLSTYSYWVVFMVMLDWAYPICVFINDDQKNITDISKIIKRVNRFVLGTNCLKYIPSELKPYVRIKYEAFVKRFYTMPDVKAILKLLD